LASTRRGTARTADGYANLCRLISARHCDGDFDVIRAVRTHRHGLIILSDDLAALQQWKQDGREDLFVELTPGAMMHHTLAWSRTASIPPVAKRAVTFSSALTFICFINGEIRGIQFGNEASEECSDRGSGQGRKEIRQCPIEHK
jgi:error-prone DNA polymerase